MIYDLLDLYDVKSGMGNKSRNDFDPNKYENHIVMFKEIFNNSKLPDKNKLSTTVNLKQGELERFDVKFGDVLLTSSSETPNELAMSSVALRDYPNTVYSGFSKRLRPITHLTNPQYMRYWFRSRQFRDYIDSTVSMTTRANLNMAILSAIKIDLPDLNTQKAIANILSSLDDKIELNNKINKNLEELAQTLYKRWFVDFEFPNEDGEPYKSSGGEMVESELGLIPEGWSTIRLQETVKVIDNRGKTPPLEAQDKRFPIIDVKALSGDGPIIDYDNCMKFVNENTYNNWFRNGHPKKNDILISTVGSLAEMKLFIENKGAIAQNVVAFRSTLLNPFFLYQHLINIKNDLISYNIGSVQPSIKVTHIINHIILKPSDIILENYSRVYKSFVEMNWTLHNENKKLSKLRDELLPKLMNGEIELPIEE